MMGVQHICRGQPCPQIVFSPACFLSLCPGCDCQRKLALRAHWVSVAVSLVQGSQSAFRAACPACSPTCQPMLLFGFWGGGEGFGASVCLSLLGPQHMFLGRPPRPQAHRAKVSENMTVSHPFSCQYLTQKSTATSFKGRAPQEPQTMI